MSEKIELLSSCWTISGVTPDSDGVSRFGFRDRVEAAARAGFTGMGLWHADLEHIQRQTPLKEMKRILDGNGIRYVELEFLTDWFTDGEKRARSDWRRNKLLEAAEALGVRDIKVGDFNITPCPWPRIVESFAALCSDFAQCGALVGFEFMGVSMLNNLRDALRMAQEADAANGGIVLDIVHAANQHIPDETIARIPSRLLINVELNDGLLFSNPNRDPRRERVYCGEGEYDIKGFIKAVQKTGYKGPWGVEVYSEEIAELPLEEECERAFKTTMAQFV